MYQAKLREVDLNYRDSRPIDGELGIRLGTWRLNDNLTLWVLDVKEEWAAVFWDEQIVYASSKYLEPVSPMEQCKEVLNLFGQKLSDIDLTFKTMSAQLEALHMAWEDAYILPDIEPNFNFRVPDKNGWGWLTPVQSNFLWSDEEDHTHRNSVFAWDIAHTFGANIWSPVHGQVIDIYRTQNDDDKGPGQYGSHVYIRTDAPNGVKYDILLAHLTRSRVYVNKGDHVTPNTLVSHISLEGLTSDTHVHMEIRVAPFSTRKRIDEFWDEDDFFYCQTCKVSDYI